MTLNVSAPALRFYTLRDIDTLPQLQKLDPQRKQAMRVVGRVLPFRANNYVVDELIDWDRIPDDPLFQLTFPQPEMLNAGHYRRMSQMLDSSASSAETGAVANEIRLQLNPHPEGQLAQNVPTLDGHPVAGVQHKYAETCLVFPAAGQTCHAYCTFCFAGRSSSGYAS